ncbi:MAG: hypothetical protein ACLFVB_00300 [Thermoplasmata archaeon]
MAVKNFEIRSIDAERYSEKGETRGNLRVDHNSSVTRIKKIDNNKNELNFRFNINYSNVGMIKIEGKILFEGNYPNLAKKWKKDNEMPQDVAQQIHSTIINNCIPEAVILAKELQLPPPIPLPKVNFSEQGKKDKKNVGGMEVA